MKSTGKSWFPNSSFIALSSIVILTISSSLIFNLTPGIDHNFSDNFNLAFLVFALSGNIVSLFLSGFAHTISNKRGLFAFNNSHVMISSLGVIQAGAVILGIVGKISPIESLLILNVFQIWGSYQFWLVFEESLELESPSLKHIKYIVTLCVALFTVLSFPLRNWFPVNSLMVYATVWQNLVIVSAIFISLLSLSFQKQPPLNKFIFLRTLKQHFAESENSKESTFYLFLGSTVLPTLLIASNYIIRKYFSDQNSTNTPALQSWIFIGYSFLFLPALTRSWLKIKEQAKSHLELSISAKISGKSAEKFLRRNLRDENSWAASIGIRTSVFTVDHDPEDTLVRSLPTTLMQIRNEEISRCINDLLGVKTLHSHVIGQRIQGAIDPDNSVRPCIDIIKMFAALYLDAGPLIERRISGLGTLLPIINPGLANVLKSNNAHELLKRAQWFFHFDYRWVDQNIVNTPKATRYGVQMDPLANELRHSMIAHLRKSNAMGSFLWMGKDAQSRLLQEAPMLASIIEPVTISNLTGEEHLVFTIKFETLIPRLQRYFELDSLRSVLMDYEISSDASKLINIYRLQGTQANTAESMMHLVESVSSHSWRGFKEKDQALKIIVTAHKFAERYMIECQEKNEEVPKNIKKLNECIQSNIEKIGYPAQILHLAQMHKIALRDVSKLLASAKDSKDSRFEESWTLLGNMDLSRYSRQERKLVADFLLSYKNLKSPLENKSIQSKCIGAIINLAKAELNIKDFTLGLDQAFEGLVQGLACVQTDPETLTILLDGMSYLSDLSGRIIPSPGSPANANLAQLVLGFESSKAEYAQSLGNRWLERKQKMKMSA